MKILPDLLLVMFFFFFGLCCDSVASLKNRKQGQTNADILHLCCRAACNLTATCALLLTSNQEGSRPALSSQYAVSYSSMKVRTGTFAGSAWSQHSYTFSAICSESLPTFQVFHLPQASFAASPLLVPISQRVNTTKVASSRTFYERRSSVARTRELASASLSLPQEYCKPASVTSSSAEDSEETPAGSTSTGLEYEHKIATSAATSGASCNNPAVFVRHTLQTALNNSKCIAEWAIRTFIYGPVKLSLIIFRRTWLLFHARGTSKEAPDDAATPTLQLPAPLTTPLPEKSAVTNSALHSKPSSSPTSSLNPEATSTPDSSPAALSVRAEAPSSFAPSSPPRSPSAIKADPSDAEQDALQTPTAETQAQPIESASQPLTLPDTSRQSPSRDGMPTSSTADAEAVAAASRHQHVQTQKLRTRKVSRLASDHMDRIVRRRMEQHGHVYSEVDMEELFPGCWVLVDKELGKLGQGTYANVVYAELEMNGEMSMLAVKVMKEVAEADMVDREMEALAAVQGLPHFIQQLDSKYHRHADDSGPALIVTRLVEGIPFARMMYGLWRIREEPGGEAKFLHAVVRMFSQFVEGMQQLHRLGRAHNDLKPDNLMVCHWQELDKVQLVIVDVAGSIVQGTWDGIEYPQVTAEFSAPDALAALAHLINSSERWTKPVNFLAHDRWSMGCILSFMLSQSVTFACLSHVHPGVSTEDPIAIVQQRHKEWRGFLKGKPVAGAPANAVDVLSKGLSGNKLNKARQVVGQLLHPSAKNRLALADVDVTFLLE